MVTCGIQTQAGGRPGKEPYSLRLVYRQRSRSFVCVGLLLLCFVLSGCMSMQIGSPPRIEGLKTLEAGVSNKKDILLTLGEPRGYGGTRFMPNIDPRKIWFYEYVASDGRKVGVKFLLVFLCNELYEGHLWFSESQFLEVTEK